MAIPALVVSGFLGSGKTTLVRRLLDQARADGVRLAIVSNEFGDVGIDKALLEAGSGGIVELDGGCVCCRLSDALGETLQMLLGTSSFDRLVIETSGVALPGEMLVQFWRPPIDALITKYASLYGIPEALLHRVVRRESTYNPRAFNRGHYGLMQIKYSTAKSMGYEGPAEGLFDAETNIKYAGKYLRGAWMVADDKNDGAVRLYAAGYYYHAKRKGLLEELGMK